MGSMANKLKHKKMLQQSLLHEHPIEVEKLHKKQLTIEKRTSPKKKQHGPPNLPVHETHTEQVEKLYERQELHERQLTLERRTSPRKKQHGPQNLPVHETHTEQVEKLHERQELHERQQLIIERRTSPRKKHQGPQNSLVHETYTKKVGKLHERKTEELNVELPETNLKLGSTKGHDNANSKKRGRGQTMKQAAQLQTLEKLHEKQDKRKQVSRELNMEETEFT
ncbi:hypothetical protein Dimus_005877 [Dionaea muscipula]